MRLRKGKKLKVEGPQRGYTRNVTILYGCDDERVEMK